MGESELARVSKPGSQRRPVKLRHSASATTLSGTFSMTLSGGRLRVCLPCVPPTARAFASSPGRDSKESRSRWRTATPVDPGEPASTFDKLASAVRSPDSRPDPIHRLNNHELNPAFLGSSPEAPLSYAFGQILL